ncbi:uncharacterized protein LOC101861292 [Aplysia californica]|uniref:Uncharacterized protein LOC101861292 n=1 Tax=Aplysia californica TaxID=6500 RepID=A0ABM0JU64_APLCA|nr:uncharacterized protein LOC101861292 [Aplysia californica]
MSRRKQSRPRPVKAVGEAVFPLAPSPKAPCDSHGQADDDDDNDIVVRDKLIIALSPSRDGDDDDDDDGSITRFTDDSRANRTMSVSTLQNSVLATGPPSHPIPPNFLLPSPTSAFSVPPPIPYLPFAHPSTSDYPTTPSSSKFNPQAGMARKKRSPSNRKWAQQITSPAEADILKCDICSAQGAEERKTCTLVEKQDYYIENDGTLTVRNGVCTRRLVLGLFGNIANSPKKYKDDLGENFMKFLLNLDQILKNQHMVCPDESSLQAITAQNVLMTHLGTAKLQTALSSRKRPREISGLDGRNQTIKGAPQLAEDLTLSDDVGNETTADEKSAPRLPDNFLSFPSDSGSALSQFTSDDKTRNEPVVGKKTAVFPSNEVSGDEGSVSLVAGLMGGFSDPATPDDSAQMSSRPESPTGSIGQIDGSKQMANTKRGSKILPVASVNGQTHYICPVCSLELSNDHELTVHIRSHNQSSQQALPNTCTICGKTLSSQSSLDRHMLVHSGERPFKCKTCGMSFTTNGNMHRHSRIHAKNGMAAMAKSTVRKPSEPKPGKKDTFAFDKMGMTGAGPSQSPFHTMMPSEYGNKLERMKNHQEQERGAEFLQQYYNDVNKLKAMGMAGMAGYMFPFTAPHHPAFPFHQMFSDPTRVLPFMPRMMDPVTGEIFAKRARISQQMMAPMRPPSPDLRSSKPSTCTVCKAEFSSEFALESHMESHVIVDTQLEAESGNACKTCQVVAKSEESLLLHTLTHHMPDEELADLDTPPKTGSSSETADGDNSSNNNNNNNDNNSNNNTDNDSIKSGFQELGFASFTTKKFPLIAKAFCESKTILKSESEPVFKCQECGKGFPVEGARDLHEASHLPEEYTTCPKCNCHFSDSLRLQEHMLKHVSDIKFDEYLSKHESEEEAMPQNYFLAQFGLISKDSPEEIGQKHSIKTEDDESIDLSVNDNDDYAMSDAEDRMDFDNCKEEESEPCASPGVTAIKKEESATDSKLRLTNFFLPSSKSAVRVPETKGFPLLIHQTKQSDRPTSVPVRSSSESDDLSGQTDSQTTIFESSVVARAVVHPPVFPCKHCDVILASPKDLEAHQLTHKSQYECLICNYTSTDKSTLQRHMRTHSGERPYKCKICEYSFTTKANCERHLRQRHGLHKDQLHEYLTSNKYVIASRSLSPSDSPTPQSFHETVCKSCGLDCVNSKGLRQHLQNAPDCRMGFICKKCDAPFSTKDSVMEHMNRHHPEVRGPICERFICRAEVMSSSLLDPNNKLSAPPPAHSTPASADKPKEKPSWLKEISIAPHRGDSAVVKKFKSNTLTSDFSPQDVDTEGPLDFSKQVKPGLTVEAPSLLAQMSGGATSPAVDTSTEDQPMDLSVSSQKPSASATLDKVQDCGVSHSFLHQEPYGLQGFNKEKSTASFSGSTSSIKVKTDTLPTHNSQLRESDGNNNQLSPLFTMSSGSSNTSIPSSLHLPPDDASSLSPAPHTPKHPAFPQFLPMVAGYPSLLSAAGPQSMSFQAHPALTQRLALMSRLHPSFVPPTGKMSTATPNVSGQAPNYKSMEVTDSKTDSLKLEESVDQQRNNKRKDRSSKETEKSDIKLVNKPIVDLIDIKKKKPKSSQGSSCESDSSCELASVNKILDATDAQNFQDYLIIPETEDEQDNKSESVQSGDESNQSLENMFSQSQSLLAGQLTAKLSDSSDKDSADKDKNLLAEDMPITINMALIDGNIPASVHEKTFQACLEQKMEDPSNMSEQAIAELIEKVSRENVNSPAKKKRNSYADSPHKFTCPYCPRCFPWLSSLNRHLLTHTGQKPFKCPRCPVTFSTKSNRERHLIRKHNVNMLDPACRATMDRPYKCHLCVFSSFSTQSNLVKHYKDRHNGMSPPAHLLEAMEKGSDGEGEDSNGNPINGPSYEDEEEFNLSEMRNGLSDKEIMFHNYSQDSDSNQGSNGTTPSVRDPHKKRNAIFNFTNDIEGKNGLHATVNTSNSSSVHAISPKPESAQPSTTNRPGIDDTVLTDTMKKFLDKSVRQALEDSHRRAMEEGSPFIITPAIEKHLRNLSPGEELLVEDTIKRWKNDTDSVSRKLQLKSPKESSSSSSPDLPFKCYLCEASYTSRVECLQHQSQSHSAEWDILKDKNDVGSIQVFATRLDKMIDKQSKKGKEVLAKQQAKEKEEVGDATEKAASEEDNTKCREVPGGVLTRSKDNKVERNKDGDETESIDGEAINHAPSYECSGDEGTDPSFLQEVVSTDYLQRKVHCSLCPKRFWCLQDLRRHMRSHTGEHPFSCNLCPKKFTLKHSLNRHMAKHHAGAGMSLDAMSDDEESEYDVGGQSSKPTKDSTKRTSKSSKEERAETKEENEDNDDMLHNLLGVESATIDQLLESKDSAASLLGVGEGKTQPPK